MKGIRGLLLLFAAGCIAASSVFVGYTLGRQGAQAPAASKGGGEGKEEKEVTAKVKVARAQIGPIDRTVAAFGTVVASPEDVQTISVPFECRVRRVLAVAGQAIEAGAKLMNVEPSPDAILSLSDARFTKAAAERDLSQVRQRLEMKLATKADLSSAEQTLQLAQSKLDSLEKRGIEAKQLPAGLSGLVSKVNVQEGQVVPAGGPLVEVVPTNRIQVRLGIEPSKAGQLKPEQEVHLQTVQGPAPVKADARLKMVTQRVNPTSRLVDAYVSLPADSPFMLETFVQARIVVESKQALIVPRSAVLPEEGKHKLFVLRKDKAEEREVEIGLEDEDHVELTGDTVKAGDLVVIEGNAELETGMAVEVAEEHEPAREPTTGSRPASAPGSED